MRRALASPLRRLSSLAAPETLPFDVCIVGGGPAGLAAAIRLRQLASTTGDDVSVALLEKGADVGSHSLSGCVLDHRGLDELLPDWRGRGLPLTPVSHDATVLLATATRSLRVPTPPAQHTTGCSLVSLSQLSRFLAAHAEELGATILPGFPAAALLHADGATSGGRDDAPLSAAQPVVGVATAAAGIGRDGSPSAQYSPPTHITATVTLLAEGARGHLSEAACEAFGLRAASGPQTYGLGIKEVWQVPAGQHVAGTVLHTLGWPLFNSAYGGGFVYHLGEAAGSSSLVALGLVTGLDYSNPYLSPYQEFQRWKTHPTIAATLAGGTCLQYGARVLTEGGFQALPRLAFPGGALVGDAAGTLNAAALRGVHTAIASGRAAGEAAFLAVLLAREGRAAPADLSGYDQAFRASWAGEELWLARNVRPSFRAGFWPGVAHAALDTFIGHGRLPYTLRHSPAGDHGQLRPAAASVPIPYPPPDGRLTFDIPTSLARSGTDHSPDQPPHLRVSSPAEVAAVNLGLYDGPEGRYCPAGVYEWEAGKLRVHPQGCLHCKACSVKDPGQRIRWTPPEGGGGPQYTLM